MDFLIYPYDILIFFILEKEWVVKAINSIITFFWYNQHIIYYRVTVIKD